LPASCWRRPTRLRLASLPRAAGPAALCALVCCGTATAAATPSVRVGQAPALPRGTQTAAPLPAASRLQLTVALQPQDPSGLASFAEEVATPSSPRFRHYLGVGEFAERFGATPAQIALVRSALQAQGLDVAQPAANDLTLPVSGTAAQVERAFSISLAQVELPSGRTAYANAQAPALPAAAARDVQGVIGLDDVALDQPQQASAPSQRAPGPPRARRRSSITASLPADARSLAAPIATGGPQPCEAARAVPEEFGGLGETADQIATAYQLSSLYGAGDFGAGQTIALFEQEAFQPSDITAYQACYGTSASVEAIDVDGGPKPFNGEDAEAALDIEQLVGLAPQAHVLVYQGPIDQSHTPIEIISRIVSDDRAKVISTSWGICEAYTVANVISTENTLLQEAAAQGQSFFAASGDSGSEQCEQAEPKDTELAVLNPASQPFATGVGGTTLYGVDAEANKHFPYDGTLSPGEGVWNNGPYKAAGGGGSGGGVSARWPMPSYQSAASGSLGVINAESSGVPCGAGTGHCREVPDVSADADPQSGYVVYIDGGTSEGGWTILGGTSAAAPLWAAFTALANSSPACRGLPIGFANPSLYAIAGSAYSSNFRDIVEPSPFTGHANNNAAFGVGPFAVTPGYDMATGIGAPLAPSLAASLCATAKAPEEAHKEEERDQAEAPHISSGAPTSNALPSIAAPVSTPTPPSDAVPIGSAQLRGSLVAQLTPSGNAARIGNLLKPGGGSLAFTALQAGSLVIDWYELPSGAKPGKNAKPKPVLVASAHITFTAAGRRTVKLALTRAGRTLLARAKQIRLSAKGTFTPRGKAPITATKSLLLKR
jgi:subtilase family serine protease